MFLILFIDLSLLRILLFVAGISLTLGYSSLDIEITNSILDILPLTVEKTAMFKLVVYTIGFIDLILALFLFSYLEKNVVLIITMIIINLSFIISLIQLYITYQGFESSTVITSILSTLLCKLILRLDSTQQYIYLQKLYNYDKRVKKVEVRIRKLLNPLTHKEVLEVYKTNNKKINRITKQEIQSEKKNVFEQVCEFLL